MRLNNSTPFHADIQKNTVTNPLLHSFHAFHGLTRVCVMHKIIDEQKHIYFLAHVNKCRVHRGISGIKGFKVCFEKAPGGTAWNYQVAVK